MSIPNEEERKRMVDDALRNSKLIGPQAISPEQDVANKLQAMDFKVGNIVRNKLKRDGFIADPHTTLNEVAEAYNDLLRSWDRDTIQKLLAAMLGSALLARYR